MTDTPGDATAPGAPAPGAKRAAIDAEQAHLERVHGRIDHLRQRASRRSASAAGEERGGTFQSTYERDVTTHHHAARAARLTFGDVESLAFGRLDTTDADTLHIGRLSVIDEEGDVLLVDWRAPAAGAFYRATAATPEGVARRRTLTTRGREVEDLDDEIIDADAAEALELEAVTGQGALLAALSRSRTGQLRDVVATIQADQDAIIRAPAAGTLIVAGGPGTGKTVVALHRVASLLYRDRIRFEGRGVLVVGPSDAFTEHTARVLPSLGEDQAVQRSLGQLAPTGATVAGWDTPEVAAVKGDLAMADLCRRVVQSSPPALPPETRVSFEATTVRVTARELEAVRRRLLGGVTADRPGASYHARSSAAEESLRAALWRAWRRAHRDGGGRPPEERAGSGFDAALDEQAQVTMLRRCWWPPLDPVEVLGRLARGELALEQVAVEVSAADRELLADAFASTAGVRWTVDDVGLLDEVDAILGPPLAARGGGPGRTDDGGIQLTSDRFRTEAPHVDVGAPGYRDFAHVVVDEAQDLSPMLWRTVARRGPYASWTVVGDLAQRSRTAEPSTWEAVAATLGRRRVEVRWLSVNYRTPAEIVDVARSVLVEAGLDPASVPTSVREAGFRPTLHRVVDPVRRAADLAAASCTRHDGTVAVLAPERHLAAAVAAIEQGPAATQLHARRLRVLDPRTAKGLEFDDVIVVAPDEIVASSTVGAHQLYVAVTRATRSLAMVARPEVAVPGTEHLDPRD